MLEVLGNDVLLVLFDFKRYLVLALVEAVIHLLSAKFGYPVGYEYCLVKQVYLVVGLFILILADVLVEGQFESLGYQIGELLHLLVHDFY